MSACYWPGASTQGAALGGKAGTLAALHGRELAIPAWFAVLPEAFTEIREPNGAVTPGLTSAAVRELSAGLQQLAPHDGQWAVRSSAHEEDGQQHSFAGQLETFLRVPTADVPDRVLAVARSAASERVRAYREQRQLPAATRPPAVIVQRMVEAEVAGVAFGADPVTGQTDRVIVTAVSGLGDALVDGTANADTWQVDPAGGLLTRQTAGPLPVLEDAQIVAVAALARRLGLIFGGPQDVEWAIAGGVLYLLQARPITTLPPRGPQTIWDNSNIIESYSGVTTPLTFSFARRAYEGVYRQFCQILAVPHRKLRAQDQTFRNMIGLVQGRVYYHLINWYRVLALLPGFTLNRRFMEQMMGVKEELPAEVLADLGAASLRARVRDGLDLAFSVVALIANHFLLPRKIRLFQARLNAALAPAGPPLTARSPEELIAHFRDLEVRLLTRWDAPLLNDFFAMIFFGVLRRLTTKWLDDTEGTLSNDLLCDEGGIISAEPARRIAELARLAASKPELVTALCDRSRSEIEAMLPGYPEFAAGYAEYLAVFGERCLEELKLETLTLHDDPLMLLRAIGQFARTSGSRPAVPTGIAPRILAEQRCQAALSGQRMRRWIFGWVLRNTRARVRDRENLRFERTRLFGRVRRLFVELGRHRHASGHLADPRDIFHLELDEALALPAPAAVELRERVARRQAEFARYRAMPAPPRRFTTEGEITAHTLWTAPDTIAPDSSGETRRGLGCCPGIVRGRVRKVTDPRSANLHPGEILVAERTDPGWILVFPSAAALLIERGSLLSHSAIVARELRLPAIVAIDGLTAWLQDGDEVELDGRTGWVRRLEPTPLTSLSGLRESDLSIRPPAAPLATLKA